MIFFQIYLVYFQIYQVELIAKPPSATGTLEAVLYEVLTGKAQSSDDLNF